MGRSKRGSYIAGLAGALTAAGLVACGDYSSYGAIQRGTGGTRTETGGSAESGGMHQTGGAPGVGGVQEPGGVPGSGGAGATGGSAVMEGSAGRDAGDSGGVARGGSDASTGGRSADAGAGGGDSGNPPPAIRLTFDQRSDYDSFHFITPTPYTHGPGVWIWDQTGNPHMTETTDAIALDPVKNPSGTYALYDPESSKDAGHAGTTVFGDVRVSAHIQSVNGNSVGIVLRYVDETHFYRFWVAQYGWDVARGDGDTMAIYRCWNCIPPGPNTFDNNAPRPNFDHSIGHTFVFEAKGTRLRAWIDQTLMADFEDSKYTQGLVGLYDRANTGAQFDDVVIQPL